jgi:repressor LexA
MTPRQKECLDFIKAFWAENEFAPSFEEIKDTLGAKSKSSVTGLVSKLEARGYIERIPNLARSIRIVQLVQPPEEAESDVPPVAAEDDDEPENPYAQE